MRILSGGYRKVVARLPLLVVLGLAVSTVLTLRAGPVSDGSAEESVPAPDLHVVGWTVDDSPDGNGDGGLHPGETAFLQIHLSNRGNQTAFNVSATLRELIDHPDVTIEDKIALWPDLPATGAPGVSAAPHFKLSVATTRPCAWEIPLQLELTAANGYFETRTFTLVLVDPRSTELSSGAARPFVFGVEQDDWFGFSAAAGDLNGDGFDELIVGAPQGDGPAGARAQAGEAAVIYGAATRSTDVDLAAPPAGTFFVYGADADDKLGQRVATGDVDGDGYDDLLVSSVDADGPANGRPRAGEVALIYGDAAALIDIDLDAPVGDVARIFGEEQDDFLGRSVALGDLDGDGFDDLILGANGGDGPGNARTGAGEVAVIYGGPTRLIDIDLANPPGNVVTIHGAENNDALGRSVGSGDLDGDGFDELILGADGGDGPSNARSFAGEAVLLYGGARLGGDVDLATAPAGTIFVFGADANDSLGEDIATGDLDDDGLDELVLGANGGDGADDTRSLAGEVAVLPGGPRLAANVDLASPPDGATLIFGVDALDNLGERVTTGDIDGDGYGDLILAADGGDGPGNGNPGSGEAVLVYGGSRPVRDVDLASAPANVEFVYGVGFSDNLGSGVAAGDLNGDGYCETLLGASFADGPDDSRSSAGEVAVLAGATRTRYRHDPDSFSFIDASAGTDLGLTCDDCGVTIPIGFELDFFGRKYDQVGVSSNGYLTFGGPTDQPGGFCIPASNPPNDLIAVFWDDLNLETSGAVYSLLEGTAPNRRLTVQWDQAPLYPNVDAATFEVTLFESSDQILFQYQDVIFGNGSDGGGNAVIGVESGNGYNGTAVSCFSGTIADASAVRLRRFADPTVVFSDDVEAGAGGWAAGGLWHRVMEPDCTPSARSGDYSWYYGQDLSCDYDTTVTNSGTLTSPAILDLAQDASLSYWQRRGTDGTTDTSTVELQADGGGFQALRGFVAGDFDWSSSDDFFVADSETGEFAAIDLSSFAGQDIDLRFAFDTLDALDNTNLGWMIDDIEIRACPVFAGGGGGGGAATQARATPQPSSYCETETGQVDALGSYCTVCPSLTYQWSRNGVPIGGATGVRHDIPGGQAPGAYNYTVEIGCSTSTLCDATSDAAVVTVVEQPFVVGPTLTLDRVNGGVDLQFLWNDVAGASEYGLFADTDPSGAFTDEAGSAASGATGLTLTLPPDTLLFYLVGGRNPVCGTGPLR